MSDMADYVVKPLAPDTWDAFARLAERHNGVWNGCWCTWSHTLYAEKEKGRTAESNRALKEGLVRQGRAHAALVFDGDEAIAWCEYGTPAELPNIYHRKEYEAALDRLPDYRLTCFFVDKKYRRKGMARVALDGALHLIAQAGGGLVEGYPHDTDGQKVSASFLYNGTRSLFEQAGFSYVRGKGKNNCVMRIVVAPAMAPKSGLSTACPQLRPRVRPGLPGPARSRTRLSPAGPGPWPRAWPWSG